MTTVQSTTGGSPGGATGGSPGGTTGGSPRGNSGSSSLDMLHTAIKYNHPYLRLIRLATITPFPLEGALFGAINVGLPYDKKLFSILLNKNTTEDIPACLFLAIARYPKETEFLLELTRKAEEYLPGCLLHAIVSLPYNKKLFRALFEKTESFVGCFFSALEKFPTKTKFLLDLLGETEDLSWCLLKATEGFAKGVDRSVVDATWNAVLGTTALGDRYGELFNGVLYWTICYFKDDLDYIYSVLEKTTNFSWCLWVTLSVSPDNNELIEKLIPLTTDFELVLHCILEKAPYKTELARRIIPKTTNFTGCLALAVVNAPKLAEEIFVASGCVKEPLLEGMLLSEWERYFF